MKISRFRMVGLLFVITAIALCFLGKDWLRQRMEEKAVVSYLSKPRQIAPSQWIQHPVEKDAFNVKCKSGDMISAVCCKVRNPTGTVVILHGVGSCKDHMAWMARQMNDWGYNAVVYDSRAHGQSSGSTITYGHVEKQDLADVIAEVRSRYDPTAPIGVLGTSMGAAVAAQALPLIPFAKCEVLVSPFANFQHEFAVILPRMPDFFRSAEVQKLAEEKLGCQLSSISPVSAVAHSTVPILVIHGSKDDTIAESQGLEVFKASPSPDSRWFPVEGAGHDMDIFADGKAWHDAVYAQIRDFLALHMKTNNRW